MGSLLSLRDCSRSNGKNDFPWYGGYWIGISKTHQGRKHCKNHSQITLRSVILIETLLIAGLTCGIATHYGVGDGFHGQTTANGERFDAYRWTAAHPYLPMGTKIRVTNQDNLKQVIVRVNDRGPFSHADIDLSYGAFTHIASPRKGNTVVCWRVVG